MSEIVPATADDYEAMYGEPPCASLQGYVVKKDGKPVAIGGLYYQYGRHVVFSEIKEPVRKRDILRVCHLVLGLAKQKRATVFSLLGKLPTSINLLKHFNFQFVMNTPQGDLYQWNSKT